MQYKENQDVKINKQSYNQNGSFHLSSQNIDLKKDDTTRKIQKRNSLSQERNEIIQLKNLYQTENVFANKSRIQNDYSINQDLSNNPLSTSSYAINQRRGEFYSPREEDKYKSFKNAITSKLFKSNQQSPACTPRNSVYGNNSSRENSQTYRLRTGRLKVTQDGFYQKTKKQYIHYKNAQSNSQQNESSDIQGQQDIKLIPQSQASTPIQNKIPVNQQKILNLVMNNSSQKKMKQFLQKNGLTNLLNQQKQGQLIQMLKQNQTNKQQKPKTINSATVSQNSSSIQHSKKQSSYLEQSQIQSQTTSAFNSSRSSQKNHETKFINNTNEQNKQQLLEELYQSFDSLNYRKKNKQNINQILQNNQQQSIQSQSKELNSQNCIQQSQIQQQKGSQKKQIQTNIQDKFINEDQIVQIKQISGTEPLINGSSLFIVDMKSLNIGQQSLNIGAQLQKRISDQQSSGLKQQPNGSDPFKRKMSLGNSANTQLNNSNISSNNTNWQNYMTQKSGYNNIQNILNNNNFSRNTSIHMITPNKSKSTTSSNNGTSEKSSVSKQIQNIQQQQQQQNQQQLKSTQEKDIVIQQQKSQAQQSIIQTKQKESMLSRITTQANTTNITTNNSNYNNNNSTNNWDNNTQDSLYFQKKIKEINKIENLFHRKDSLPEGKVLSQNYSSKKQDSSSKKYVMDDTDIPISLGQNDDLNTKLMSKRDVQTARKKSAKQKNLFNSQEKNVYQIALKNICNFPIKVSHSIGKIKNNNAETQNTRGSSINNQVNNTNITGNNNSYNNSSSSNNTNITNNLYTSSNKKKNSKILNQEKTNESNLKYSPEGKHYSHTADLNRLVQQQTTQQQPPQNKLSDIDFSVFNQFITNNTQQFQISLAKRINSKLNYLKERIEKQREENQNIKNVLKGNKNNSNKTNQNQQPSTLSVNSQDSFYTSSLSSNLSSSSISS